MRHADWVTLLHAKRVGRGWKARCPAHEDDSADSLGVDPGDGCTLLKCWAGCATEAVVGAVGKTMADLFDEPRRLAAAPEPDC
ncbi:MAG TPA: hypothetical protein VLB49_17475, partial [Gemmatimonadales bacterium]|nr:hypothetical protein [Gemmatimonadales bacterium]